MSDDELRQGPTGPVMLSMTSALKPPPARIAKIGNNLVLPRSIPLLQGAAGVVGALVGLIFTTIFVIPFFGATLTTFGLGAGVFGALAVLLVSWSPLRGESFARWIGLNLSQLRLDKVEIDGMRAKAYIGIAPLHCSALGEVRIASGAAEVLPGTVDERGVIIPHAEQRKMIAGDRGGRLPGAEEGFDRPRWLAEGELNGDQNRAAGIRSDRRNAPRASDVLPDFGAAAFPAVDSGSRNPHEQTNRWDAPAPFDKPKTPMFEQHKNLPDAPKKKRRKG